MKRGGDKERGRGGDEDGSIHNRPTGWIVDHFYEHAEDEVVFFVQLARDYPIEVAALDGEFQPDLGLGGFSFRVGQLADECRRIAALSPGFSQIRTDRAR